MNEELIRKTNLFGAWCAIYYVVLLVLGWWVIGGYFPLHKPSAGAEEVAAFYQGDVTFIRLGLVIVMWGAAIFLPFTAALAEHVARIEGRNGPLTRIITMAGYANAMLTFYPPLYWLAAAFRPQERSIELTYLLSDIAWLQFLGGISLVMPIYIVVGIAILNDKSPRPVFPRWAAYVSFMVFLLFIPDQLLFFIKSGPFAWNGLIAFWIPLTIFFGWFMMMFWFMRRDALQKS
jgi:hypothetical protein